MTIKRWNARRDKNEPAIVQALEAVGAQVMRLDSFDLLVRFRGQLHMLDVKMPKGRATMAQKTLSQLGWPLHYVETPEAALRAIGAL